MRFSIAAVTLAFTAYVQAASFNKRCDEHVSACLNSLTDVKNRVLAINNDIATISCPSTFTNMLLIHNKVQSLQDDLDYSSGKCSLITELTETEFTGLRDAFEPLSSAYVNNYDAFSNNFGCYTSIVLTIIKAGIKLYTEPSVSLFNQLYSITPSNSKSVIQGLIDPINAASANTYTVYGIV